MEFSDIGGAVGAAHKEMETDQMQFSLVSQGRNGKLIPGQTGWGGSKRRWVPPINGEWKAHAMETK